jgi:hypothetical protein
MRLMPLRVQKPCSNCPFLKVGAISLREGRVEGIVAHLLADDRNGFPCHKTTQGTGRGAWAQCAGSMIYLLKIGQPSVAMRLGAAVKALDYSRLRAQSDDIIEPLDWQERRQRAARRG